MASCDNTGGKDVCRCCNASCIDCEHKPKPEATDILKFIEDMRAVTPGELISRYGKGDHNILIGNVYVAFGLPDDLVTVLLGLLHEKKLYISPCGMGILDWLTSGSPMPNNLKLAGKRAWGAYKTERWYPCEFMTKKWFTYRIDHLKCSKKEKEKLLENAGIRRR
jgi:hypothetical protein